MVTKKKTPLIEPERMSDLDHQVANDTKAYKVSTPINLGTLGKEIANAHGWGSNSVIVSAQGDLDNASVDNPVFVWVHSNDVEDHLVNQVIKDHQIIKPSAQNIWKIIEAKANQRKTFTPEEIQNILERLVRGEL